MRNYCFVLRARAPNNAAFHFIASTLCLSRQWFQSRSIIGDRRVCLRRTAANARLRGAQAPGHPPPRMDTPLDSRLPTA